MKIAEGYLSAESKSLLIIACFGEKNKKTWTTRTSRDMLEIIVEFFDV